MLQIRGPSHKNILHRATGLARSRTSAGIMDRCNFASLATGASHLFGRARMLRCTDEPARPSCRIDSNVLDEFLLDDRIENNALIARVNNCAQAGKNPF